MDDDTQLLKQYAETGSEQAFRELVERHIQLVNSTALRSLAGDVHLAKDVTQVVFTDLARKAASLPEDMVLGGWLHRHTCFTAAKTVRTEIRRRARERTAMEINAVNESSLPEAHWQQLAPVLDDALNQLGAQDRDAIVLRYLQSRDLRSIGRAIGTNEDAAQKRISRALEKLRGFLTRRGITLSTALLATTLDAGAKTPAVPMAVVVSISTAALSGAASATSGITLTSLLAMSSSKTTLAIAGVAALALLTTLIVTHNKSLETAKNSSSTGTASSPMPTKNSPGTTVANLTPPAVASADVPKTGLTVSPEARSVLASPAPAVTVAATTTDTATSANNPSPQAGASKGLQFIIEPFDGAKAIQDYVTSHPSAKAIIGSVDPNSLDILPPLALYSLDMPAIAAGGGLESAHKMGGDQFLVESSGQYVATAMLAQDNLSGKAAVMLFNNGKAGILSTTIDGEATARALEQLAELDQVKAGSYEVRILRLAYISGGRNSTLLWLKSNTESPDLFYIPPQQVMPDPLQVEKVYTADEFFKLALPIMQQKQAEMTKRMPPPGGG